MFEVIQDGVKDYLATILAGLTLTGVYAYFKRRHRKRAKFPSPRICRLDDVRRWVHDIDGGMSDFVTSVPDERLGVKLLERLIDLDTELGINRGPLHEGTAEQWAPVFQHHPETWALIAVGPFQIVGYWHFACLDDFHFAKAKDGSLFDSEINAASVVDLSFPGTYNAYMTAFGVKSAFKSEVPKLVLAFYRQLDELADQGKFMREIATNAVTDLGVDFCERAGMHKIGKHTDEGQLYSLVLHPWPTSLRFPKWEVLAEKYRCHFAISG